uniref:Putative plant transposon protein domain-containing protein n=1 Tax=Solanum tuberosum TaxID=4113 RepID=M1E183_SOLTU
MTPKGKNVASDSGTKRSRIGAAAESSSWETTNLLPQKFGKQVVMHYGEEWYDYQLESKYMGDEVRDMGRHLTLHYGHLNLDAEIWLKIMSSTLLPCKHTTEVTRERVVLVYQLMKRLPINVGAILRQNMLKFWTNMRWCLCYGNLITSHDQSHRQVLTVADRQAQDDSWMGCMFGMAELQLWISGRPVTEDEMETLAEHYPLTDSRMYMCQMGPAFQEPIDDDDTTFDKEDGSEKDVSNDVGTGDDDIDAGD